MTVKGISVSSTRQLTVGIMNEVERAGTPKKPSSRKGISNSRFRSLRTVKVNFGTCTAFGIFGNYQRVTSEFAYP